MEQYDKSYMLTKGKPVRGKSIKDLTGYRSGRLVAIGYLGKKLCSPNKGKHVWLCKCDCGNCIKATSHDLTSGHTTSCGCKLKETCRKNSLKVQNNHKLETHGASGLDWYQNNYKNMLNRIFNPDYHAHKDYINNIQGKLIEPSWLENPWNFYKDIGKKPSKEYTVDRIDTKKGYVKGNVRWATRTTQARNRIFYPNVDDKVPVGVSLVHYTGDRLCKSNPYRAYISFHGKKINLGSFNNLDDAKKARYDAETKYGYTHTFKCPN